jgi:hypothetical protein
MSAIYEDLARVMQRERLAEAAEHRRVRHVVRARRAVRRAEKASGRARLAVALVR